MITEAPSSPHCENLDANADELAGSVGAGDPYAITRMMWLSCVEHEHVVDVYDAVY